MSGIGPTGRRVPYTDLSGQLAWTLEGRVWAGWRITNPLSYGERPVGDKDKVAATHRALWQSLGGEAILQGLITNISPVVTVRRMMARHDPQDWDRVPGARDEAIDTLDQLQDMVLGERTFWLWVPLRNLGSQAYKAPARAAARRVLDAVGAPVEGVSAAEVAARQRQADQIHALIPQILRPRPVTVAERLWVWEHACTRGLWSTPPDGLGQDPTSRIHGGSVVTEPIIDVGGRTDEPDRGRAGLQNPLTRRYVKVTDPTTYDLGGGSSYQSCLAIKDFPVEGMRFPGSEYLGNIDSMGVQVDWTVRVQINAREKVLKETQKAVRQLNDQYVQQESAVSTGHHVLDLAGQTLTDYQRIFSAHPDELDVRHSTILVTSGPTAAAAQDDAVLLTEAMKKVNIRLARPMGKEQADLWWASAPDTATNPATKRYYQRTTASDFAMAVPLISTRVGDHRGWLAAWNRSMPTMTSAVHLALMDAPLKGGSASCGVGGELGSGKTYLLKSLAGYAVDDGAQVVTIDNTTEGEWAHFASKSVQGAQVVQSQDPNQSMDLTRVLGLDEGTGPMLGFLTALLQTGLNTERGIVLASVLDPTYMREHDLTSVAQVMQHLLDGKCELPRSVDVGKHLRTHAARPYARVVFDDTLPALALDAPFIVFRTNGLKLPTRDEVATPQLFENMPPERVFGRAYYALLAHAVEKIAAMDRSRFTFFPVDESAGLTVSPEAEAAVVRFIREGRRGNQAAALGSQNPDADFGSETLKELLVYRLMMRMTSASLAKKCLTWVGLNPEDPGFADQVERLTHDTSPKGDDGVVPPHRRGEGFLRDSRGDMAWIQVRQPATPARREAIESDPPVAEGVHL